jgi:hypothetical protein
MDYSGKIIKKTPVVPSQTSASGVWTLDDALQATKSNTWPVANVPDPMSRSLRFRSSASAYLNRTPATASNRRTWTWSGWVKRGVLGTDQVFMSSDVGTSVNTWFEFGFNSSNQLYASSYTGVRFTAALFRDPSAWYHVVVALDTTQATEDDRLKFYVNGVLQSDSGDTFPVQNTDYGINNNQIHAIGQRNWSGGVGRYFDGYFAEVNFVDGQALTPSSFGGTNAVTGVWEPRPYSGTYGTNGFLLTFSDITSTATLGNDTSGNSNNWTTNNISLTAGSTYDSMLDVPTQWIAYNTGDVASVTRGNYCVMNPLDKRSIAVVSNGNLNTTSDTSGNWAQVRGTTAFPTSGKFYWEVTLSTSNTEDLSVGMGNETTSLNLNFAPGSWANYYGMLDNGDLYANNASTSGYGSSFANGDIFMIAFDRDNSKIYFGKNGTWFNSSNPATQTNPAASSISTSLTFFPMTGASGFTPPTGQHNFGQRPFSYTPPAGFVSLCTTNLPTSTILQGNQYFNATLYTGTNANQTITNSGSMQPDFVWVKVRSTSGNPVLVDSVRGANKTLYSPQTTAEETPTVGTGILSFNSNGFSLGGDISGTSFGSTNGNTFTYVGWQWRASNAAGVTNTAGSITSTVSANQTAGFSIVTYTGNGTAGATIGHGLGATPAFLIVKNRSTSGNDWLVYHKNANATPQNGVMTLNAQSAFFAGSVFWNNTAPTSSVFSVGTSGAMNNSGTAYVTYCFSAVAGYSAFGSYTGNGSSDGPFAYCGFRPRYVMIKSSSNSTYWYVYDSARNTYNLTTQILYPNLSDAEATGVNSVLDLVSNGFKIRDPGAGELNINGATFIYMAFAENPFKNALAR